MDQKCSFKRIISMILCLVLLMQALPLVQIASAEEVTQDIPEMELPEEILSSDVFYLAASTAVLNENGGTYLLRIARGGECTSESGVTLRIADYTAKYGKDYTVSLSEDAEKACSPRGNESLLEQIEGSEYTESPLLTEEEYAEMLAADPELQAQTEQGLQAAIDFIESEVDGGNAAEGSPAATSGDIPATPAEAPDPLQAARALYTGIDGTPQEVTADTDTLQQIQDVADIITQAVVGATLQINFAPGQQEKHIAVHVKDNSRGDGDRYFYFMLSDPTGTTTNSAASSCALTIIDDEVQVPSEVSFSQSEYEAGDGQSTVSVEVVREGAINTMASVHLSASSDEAMAGRDFSPVDTDVVFPIGISKRTIEIPVRSEYLSGDANIALTLDEPADCTVAGGSSEISLTAVTPPLLGAGAAEQSFGLSDIVTGEAMDITAPVVTGQSSHYDGNNKYDGSRWDLMWVDNGNWWDHTFGTSYLGLVSARWALTDGAGVDIAGAQLDWDRTGGDAEMSVGFISDSSRGAAWNKYSGKLAYESKKSFDRHTENFFSNQKKPAQVVVFNDAGCEDCNHLYIYSIKPIYRPFILEFDKSYNAALDFLNADGTRSAWEDSAYLTIAGAVNNLNDGVIRYTLEGKNAVTFLQSIDPGSSAPYVTLDYVDAVNNGNTARFATFGETVSEAYTTTLTSQWVNKNSSCFAFEDNNVVGWENQQSSVYGKRCRITLRPHFSYKDVTVRLIQPDNDIGHVVISGTAHNAGQTEDLAYHLGDVLKLKTVIHEKYRGIYEPAGYLISYKHNPSDTAWIRYQTIISMDQDDGTAAYLDENHRLRYGYYEITPLYQLTGNTISVRIRTSELPYFDSSYGLFMLDLPQEKIITTVEDGVSYVNYPVYVGPVPGQIYALTARLSADAASSCYITWQESGSAQQYVGETFFHEASQSQGNNVITLSVCKGTVGSSQRYISVSGQVTHPTYNMVTHQVSIAGQEPAEGALVNFGGGFGVAGKDGSFTASPFRVPFSTDREAYIRYVISLNGEELLQETRLHTADVSQQTVRVPVRETVIVTEDGQEVEKTTDVIKEINARVYRQSLQECRISVENGSILRDITVTPDASVPHSGGTITVDGDGEIYLLATVPTTRTYTAYAADAEGRVVETRNCRETVTAIDFLVCDAVTHQVLQTFAGEKLSDTAFRGKISASTVLPGNELYLRVTTDRSHGIYTGGVSDEGMNSTVYTNAFTGYTFIQKTTESVPVLQRVSLPADMKFDTLPLLGDTAMQFDLPFCSVGCIKTDTGYKLYFGANVTQIADLIKGSHMSRYAADNGAYYSSIFQLSHPIQSFAEGLATTYKDSFGENARALYEGNTASLGAPQWKVNVQLGVYFDFLYTTVTDPRTDVTSDACVFTGVGGYIGVGAGVKMAWYTLIPVVFIPAYFGVEIDANVLGFFGAGTDTSDDAARITFDEASHASVNFDDKLGEFSASVKMAAKVQVYVGVGLAGTIGGRGGGTFEAMALWEPSERVDDWGCALTFTLGMWIDLFLFTIPLQYSFPSVKFGSFAQYASMHGQVLPETGDVALRQPYSSAAPKWRADTPPLQAGFSPVSTQVIETNGYEHPDVQLLTLADGTVFMAFLDADPGKPAGERTVLKFTMFKNGLWTDPIAVQDDGRADFQPGICEMDDGKVMLTWLSGDPEKAAPAEPEKYLSGMEVFTTVVDTTAGVNGAVLSAETTQLTDDDYFDYAPTCVYDPLTHDRVVYYVKTSSDGSAAEMVNSYTNDCLVVYMLYSAQEGRWLFDKYYDTEVEDDDARQKLITDWHGQRFLSNPIPELGLDVPNVADFTATAYNGLSVYAYTIDQDSSNNTPGDKELFLQFHDLETHKTYCPVRLTNDDLCDALPKLISVPREGAATATDLMLFWFRGEKDVAYLNVSQLVSEGVNADGSIKEEYLTTGDGEVRTLESMYSYAEIRDNNVKGKTSMADFDVVVDGKDLYIVWTQPHTTTDAQGNFRQSREVYASALIQDNTAPEYSGTVSADAFPDASAPGSSWSDPYQLTKTGLFADEPHAVIRSDGKLMVVYNSYAQELTGDAENPVVISDFKLNATCMEPCGSIEVTDMTFSDATPLPGDEVEVQMSVRNTGLTMAADGYIVTVAGPDGIVYEIDSSNKLLPGNTDIYNFTWTIPQDLQGLCLTAVSQETGMANTATYKSDVLTPAPYYAVSTPVIYQDGEGFHLLAAVTNEGNQISREGDVLQVLLVGPYGIDGQYAPEDRIYAEVPISSLAPASRTDISTALNVIPDAFTRYGFVDCYVVVRNAEGQRLSDGEEIRVMVEQPVELLLNGKDFPEEATLRAGTRMTFTATCEPRRLNDNLSIVFSTDDPDVAVFEGSTLHALRSGTVTVTGTVMPYGFQTDPITVHVRNSSSEYTEDIQETEAIPASPAVLTEETPAPQEQNVTQSNTEGPSDTSEPEIKSDDPQTHLEEKRNTPIWPILTALGAVCAAAIAVIIIRKKKKQ